VELYWVPLGAGGVVVRRFGHLYERGKAWREGRRAVPLFHSALVVQLAGVPHVIEMAPVWNLRVPDRGVVAEGPVACRSLGRLPLFRYEVRRWAGGVIPDIAEAVGGARPLSRDAAVARRLLELVPQVPTLTWGRDELDAGDMWNSNSLVAWLLASTGLAAGDCHPPNGGRAPGWDAGLRLAALTAEPKASGRTAGGGAMLQMASRSRDSSTAGHADVARNGAGIMNVGRIVVGMDGSNSSCEALRWAKAHADTVGAELVAVSAWSYPTAGYPTSGGYVPMRVPLDIEGNRRTALEAVIKETIGDDSITVKVVQGHPANVTLQFARDAELVVVGSRGHGPVLATLLGSVSRRVAASAPCPVVVVPSPRAA